MWSNQASRSPYRSLVTSGNLVLTEVLTFVRYLISRQIIVRID